MTDACSLTASVGPTPVLSAEQRILRMVDECYNLVWRTLRRAGVPEHAVDDAAQQVFMVGARRINEIRIGEERLYLIGIAARVASDSRRREARRRETPTELDSMPIQPMPSPEDLLDRKRMREHFELIIDKMPDSLRTAFILFELEGLTVPEIAKALDIPTGTAASRLRRAREHFRARVARAFSNPRGGGAET